MVEEKHEANNIINQHVTSPKTKPEYVAINRSDNLEARMLYNL